MWLYRCKPVSVPQMDPPQGPSDPGYHPFHGLRRLERYLTVLLLFPSSSRRFHRPPHMAQRTSFFPPFCSLCVFCRVENGGPRAARRCWSMAQVSQLLCPSDMCETGTVVGERYVPCTLRKNPCQSNPSFCLALAPSPYVSCFECLFVYDIFFFVFSPRC